MIPLERFIRAMPKVELHVHLEGAIRPETLLVLARRNRVELPASDAEALRRWYTFRDFPHFIEIYLTLVQCLQTPEDIELIATEFLEQQASQNIKHTEITYTCFTQKLNHGMSYDVQLEALNRAAAYAEREWGVTMSYTIDYARHMAPEDFVGVAEWAVTRQASGVSALGLGGPEVGFPPELFTEAFDIARRHGLRSAPHAGETMGAASVRGCVEALHADRIGHGVRCLEDPRLVSRLRESQIPLEVCPSSNVCLGISPTMKAHPLPRLMEEGLYVTINSDDPPMFETTLTEEFLRAAEAFGFSHETVETLALNAARASFLPEDRRENLVTEMMREMADLKQEFGLV
ncbi:MAG: adenosine deaminase [Gemmatimonadota bacterium]